MLPAQGSTYPGAVRIISGIWRGRRLRVPVEEGLRPTPDRVRETLFNWLQPHISGARCLDLFAGSGALCLEALSRGAGSVVMVEKAEHVIRALEHNVEQLGARASARVVRADAVEYLRRPAQRFDIIFIDPPFRTDLIGRCAVLVEERGWLAPNGLIYIEAPSRMRELPIPPNWQLVRSKRAGQVGYHLARRLVLSDPAPDTPPPA